MTIRTNQSRYRQANLTPEEQQNYAAQFGLFRSASSNEELYRDPKRLRSGYGLMRPNGAATPFRVGQGNPLIESTDV